MMTVSKHSQDGTTELQFHPECAWRNVFYYGPSEHANSPQYIQLLFTHSI